MDSLKQTISTFNVSANEKNTCLKKAFKTVVDLLISGKLENGMHICVETSESDLLLFSNDENIFHYSFQDLKNTKVVSKSVQMEKLIENEKLFQKGLKSDDAMFYMHNEADKYFIGSNKEFIREISMFEKKSGEKLVLYDCNIRTCKINGRKYKRITLQNEKHIHSFSKVEFCFGHMIQGWTYIFIPKKWDEIKKELISLVNYKTTTFGSKTRVDLSGCEYIKNI